MAPRGVGKGRGKVRGRTAIAIGLVAFLVVTSSVVWRRARGSAAAAKLHDLGAQLDELQAQRAKLEGEVRRASSQVELAPKVQRLGMRVPSDSQVIDLADPVRR
jgi:outer membrane murein-binding lipoprotein Lpp